MLMLSAYSYDAEQVNIRSYSQYASITKVHDIEYYVRRVIKKLNVPWLLFECRQVKKGEFNTECMFVAIAESENEVLGTFHSYIEPVLNTVFGSLRTSIQVSYSAFENGRLVTQIVIPVTTVVWPELDPLTKLAYCVRYIHEHCGEEQYIHLVSALEHLTNALRQDDIYASVNSLVMVIEGLRAVLKGCFGEDAMNKLMSSEEYHNELWAFHDWFSHYKKDRRKTKFVFNSLGLECIIRTKKSDRRGIELECKDVESGEDHRDLDAVWGMFDRVRRRFTEVCIEAIGQA